MKSRWLWLTPLILFLLLLGGLLFLLGTPPGTRLLLSQATKRVAGLRIDQVNGTLLGRLDLAGIDYRSEGVALSVAELSLEWRPARLLRRELYLKTLSIDGVVYRPAAKGAADPPSKEGFTLPAFSLPLNIIVEKAAATRIAIGEGKEATRVDEVSFSGRADPAGIQIERGKVRAAAFEIKINGAVRTSGGSLTENYRFQLQAVLAGPGLPTAEIRMAGSGDPKQAGIESLRIDTLDGKIEGRGKVVWSPALTWQAVLTGSGLKPESQWPEWKGELAFAAGAEGRMGAAGPIGEVRLSRLEGTLRGYPVFAEAALALQEGNYRLPRLTLKSGSAALAASGKVEDRWDLEWQLHAPDLAALWPGAKGSLIGKGALRGPRLQPSVTADLRGERLALNDRQIKKLSLALRIDLQGQVTSRFELDLEEVKVGAQKIRAARLNSEGTRARHTFGTDIKTAEQHLRAGLTGALNGRAWEGTLDRIDLQDKQLGLWRLQKPMILHATLAGKEADQTAKAGASLRVEEGCWGTDPRQGTEGRLCAAGRWEAESSWEAKAQIRKIPLALLKAFLPPGLTLSGTVDGEAGGRSGKDRMEAHLRLNPSPGTIRFRPAAGEEIAVGYREGLLQADLKEARLQASAKLTLVGQGGFQADVGLSPVIPGGDWGESRLDGKIDLSLSQLGLLTALTPMIEESRGRIALHAALGGTVAEPEVKGEATLHQGSAQIPSLGIHLTEFQLTLQSRGDGTLSVRGSAKSGPGSLRIGGSVTLDAEQGWPMALTFKGDRFQILDTREAKVLASPDLTLRLQKPKIDLTGEVLIPEAALAIKALPKGAVQVSEDTVIVRQGAGGKGGDEKGAGWAISSNVMIRLGEKVTFAGFGLTAQIAGSLRAIDAPGQVTVGEGQLRILNGLYAAYGQKLSISEGRLIFAGPINNPGLDIRATRKAEEEEVVAGIQVRGTLQNPETTLFSEPPMDQAEALSYLLLGRPLNQASSSEGDFMTKAISALGLKGGDFIAKKIGRRLGLDEVKVESGENVDEATLVVGRYFSPKFYVSYGIGLFESINTLHVRYKINRILTLQGESGDETGMDLIYTKEYK